MKKILTRKDKRLLLKWLKDGAVDGSEVQDFLKEVPPMTTEEMEADFLRMQKSMYPDFCELMYKGGMCALCENKDELCKIATNHLLCREMPDYLAKAIGCGTDDCYHNRRRNKPF